MTYHYRAVLERAGRAANRWAVQRHADGSYFAGAQTDNAVATSAPMTAAEATAPEPGDAPHVRRYRFRTTLPVTVASPATSATPTFLVEPRDAARLRPVQLDLLAVAGDTVVRASVPAAIDVTVTSEVRTPGSRRRGQAQAAGAMRSYMGRPRRAGRRFSKGTYKPCHRPWACSRRARATGSSGWCR
jgi:hypothetical protein